MEESRQVSTPAGHVQPGAATYDYAAEPAGYAQVADIES
jgi:hypothetical protein